MGVIYGYTQGFSLSKYDRFSYAAADNWTSCDTSDLVTAFRYYCKSRNLALEGSVADALTTFTTTTFNNICSTLGIDPTALSAELKKTTDGNLGLRFLFSRTGISTYNRIFAEFLQNNDLEVGESVDDRVVYSSKYFTDLEGHTCRIYRLNNTYAFGPIKDNISNYIMQFGSNLKYNPVDFKNLYDNGVYNFSINVSSGYTATGSIHYISSDSFQSFTRVSAYGESTNLDENLNASALYGYFYDNNPAYIGDCYRYGSFIITENSSNPAVLHFAKLVIYDNSYGKYYQIVDLSEVLYSEDAVTGGDVYITTNNNTINNNNYNNNYTIIYNDGDTYITDDDDEPTPTTPPDGGGGGGPSSPDMPDWGTDTDIIPDGDGWKIPFSLPDLDIDWSLKDIGHKFPFCIPSDIVSFYRTLSVEPEAPSIDAHIPLGSFYDWHFVADFSEYNRWAVIIRAVEYVGFVIGLIYFTVRLVKG